MSFILDALRKSEIERQRQSGPSIAELPVAREDRRLPVALLAIGLLLAVNVGVLLFFLLRDAGGPATDSEPAAIAAAPAVAASGPAPDPAPAGAAAANVTIPADNAGQAPAGDYSDPATLPPAAPDPTLLPDAPAAAPASRVTYSEGPPQSTMPLASEASGMPELTVNVHIYYDDPANRSVSINGRPYKQGATLVEGPVIEEITRDGAVLSYRGQRFLLPRF